MLIENLYSLRKRSFYIALGLKALSYSFCFLRSLYSLLQRGFLLSFCTYRLELFELSKTSIYSLLPLMLYILRKGYTILLNQGTRDKLNQFLRFYLYLPMFINRNYCFACHLSLSFWQSFFSYNNNKKIGNQNCFSLYLHF